MNSIDLDKLEALACAATQKEWFVAEDYADNGSYSGLNIFDDDGFPLCDDENRPGDADAKFIASFNPLMARTLIALARRSLTGDAAAPSATIEGIKDAAALHDMALVPMYPNREMREVMADDEWKWEDLLAAAEAVTEDQYASIAERPEAGAAAKTDHTPVAWIATDLDGRADVGLTKEEAKRRAGECCTEFIPLYDIGQASAAGAGSDQAPVPYTATAADWSEDFSQENGNYENRCSGCGIGFMGHKRRVVCKVCAGASAGVTVQDERAKIKTWQERTLSTRSEQMMSAMRAEITDLREALAREPLPAHPVQDGEKDAARYRWLRAADWDQIRSLYWCPAVQQAGTPEDCMAALDEAIDEAIDAAIPAAQQDAK